MDFCLDDYNYVTKLPSYPAYISYYCIDTTKIIFNYGAVVE